VFTTPISGLTISLTGMIYVDDCNLLAFSPSLAPPDEVIAALQQNVLCWQGCLKTMGGALSLQKCLWGLLSSQCKGHHWLSHNALLAPQEFYILDDDGKAVPIHHIGPQEGLEVIGVTQSLLGDPSPALQALLKTAEKWQDILKLNFLPCSLIWQTLSHILWPLL